MGSALIQCGFCCESREVRPCLRLCDGQCYPRLAGEDFMDDAWDCQIQNKQ